MEISPVEIIFCSVFTVLFNEMGFSFFFHKFRLLKLFSTFYWPSLWTFGESTTCAVFWESMVIFSFCWTDSLSMSVSSFVLIVLSDWPLSFLFFYPSLPNVKLLAFPSWFVSVIVFGRFATASCFSSVYFWSLVTFSGFVISDI